MFGEPLSPAAVPMILQLANNIKNNGLNIFGIFRVSATASLVARLQDEYETSKGAPLDPTRMESSIVAATLLKQYFHSLPEPLIPQDLYASLVAVIGVSNEDMRIKMYRSLLQTLPVLNRRVLQILVGLFGEIVERSDVNKMTGSTLGLVVGPAILRPLNENQNSSPAIAAAVVCDIMDHQEELFANPHETPHFVLVSRAMFDYKGGDEDHELPFQKGVIIFLLDAEDDSGWRQGTIAGNQFKTGTFPGNYLEVILDIESIHLEHYGGPDAERGSGLSQNDTAVLGELQAELGQEKQARVEMEKLLKLLQKQYQDLKTKVDAHHGEKTVQRWR